MAGVLCRGRAVLGCLPKGECQSKEKNVCNTGSGVEPEKRKGCTVHVQCPLHQIHQSDSSPFPQWVGVDDGSTEDRLFKFYYYCYYYLHGQALGQKVDFLLKNSRRVAILCTLAHAENQDNRKQCDPIYLPVSAHEQIKCFTAVIRICSYIFEEWTLNLMFCISFTQHSLC